MTNETSTLNDDNAPKATMPEKKVLKRFYKNVDVVAKGDDFEIHLDGRPVKTPLRKRLTLPTDKMAQAVAEEWQAQGENIDPLSMPLTRLANTSHDRIGEHRLEITQELVRFVNGDQICYRADYPQSLIERQAEMWTPLLNWLSQRHDIQLLVTTGIIPQDQTAETLGQFEKIFNGYDAFHLTALHNIVTICTSVTIGLAAMDGFLDAQSAWAAAQVDENFQIENWGADDEAEARREQLYGELSQALTFLSLCA